MSDDPLLTIGCRVLHIAATCTSLGGLFYARMVTLPTVNSLEEPQRTQVLRQMIRRYAPIKWVGVTVVTVTGIIQLIQMWPHVSQRGLYLAALLLKMAAAAGLLSITAMLALPLERWERMRQRRAFWSGLNLVCGLTILIGAALMRQVRSW